jgi:hypothetical protein
MAAPNIASPATVIGKTATQAIGTSATAIVTNAASSGKALRITSLYIANVDGVATPNVTIDHFRGGTARKLVQSIDVPPGAPLVAIDRDAPLWLEEGDALRLTASAAGDLEAVCSYDEVA